MFLSSPGRNIVRRGFKCIVEVRPSSIIPEKQGGRISEQKSDVVSLPEAGKTRKGSTPSWSQMWAKEARMPQIWGAGETKICCVDVDVPRMPPFSALLAGYLMTPCQHLHLAGRKGKQNLKREKLHRTTRHDPL